MIKENTDTVNLKHFIFTLDLDFVFTVHKFSLKNTSVSWVPVVPENIIVLLYVLLLCFTI